MSKLLIVTTVPETLATILKSQPKYLSQFYKVEIATSRGETFEAVAQNEGVQVHAVSMERGISPLRDLLSLFNFIKMLQVVRPDIVHSYTPKAGLISMLGAWIARVPVRVHTFTGLIFPTSHGFRRFLLLTIDKFICACATHVVPEGNGVRTELIRHGVCARPSEVIGSGNIAGIDTAHYDPSLLECRDAAAALREEMGIGKDEFVFCYVGRLNRDKGLEELIEAFSSLQGAHLLIAGSLDLSAPVSERLMDAIASHPRVHHLGFVEDVRAVVLASAVLVLPSYREGFPNVLLQACALEVPAIATDIIGSNEIITARSNGWVVPARDSASLHKAMNEAMQLGHAELNDMGRVGRSLVIKKFERRNHWERMRRFYDGLLIKRVHE